MVRWSRSLGQVGRGKDRIDTQRCQASQSGVLDFNAELWLGAGPRWVRRRGRAIRPTRGRIDTSTDRDEPDRSDQSGSGTSKRVVGHDRGCGPTGRRRCRVETRARSRPVVRPMDLSLDAEPSVAMPALLQAPILHSYRAQCRRHDRSTHAKCAARGSSSGHSYPASCDD